MRGPQVQHLINKVGTTETISVGIMAEALVRYGWKQTSRSCGNISALDSKWPDWSERKKNKGLGADWYRRCISRRMVWNVDDKLMQALRNTGRGVA